MSRIITDGKQLTGKAMPGLLRNFQIHAVGKRIKSVGYIQENPGESPYPCLIMENGDIIVAQCDDEGNGPGVLLLACHVDEPLILPQTEVKEEV